MSDEFRIALLDILKDVLALYVRFNNHQQHLQPGRSDLMTSRPATRSDGVRRHQPFESPAMNTKHKTRQWAPTELPRMRRELVQAAEEAADRAVNDPKVAARFQTDEDEVC